MVDRVPSRLDGTIDTPKYGMFITSVRTGSVMGTNLRMILGTVLSKYYDSVDRMLSCT